MEKQFYYGKHKCKDIQRDDIIVKGVTFSLAPDAMEMEEYRGTKAMKDYLKSWGYKYIRVQSGKRHGYIFTNTPNFNS